MYLINIVLKADHLPADEQETLLNQHRTWFATYFQRGNFLLLGPYLDQPHAGVIIAQAADRAELEQILAADVYYPNLAEYEIREFKAAMVAQTIQAD